MEHTVFYVTECVCCGCAEVPTPYCCCFKINGILCFALLLSFTTASDDDKYQEHKMPGRSFQAFQNGHAGWFSSLAYRRKYTVLKLAQHSAQSIKLTLSFLFSSSVCHGRTRGTNSTDKLNKESAFAAEICFKAGLHLMWTLEADSGKAKAVQGCKPSPFLPPNVL